MRNRALLLSGGGFRGLTQLVVIEQLMAQHRYDGIYGVSVGNLNGAMAGMGKIKELRELWTNLTCIEDFLQLNWWWPFDGLYNLNPMGAYLKKHAHVKDFKINTYSGWVDLITGDYHNSNLKHCESDEQLHAIMQASSCVHPFMKSIPFQYHNREVIGIDGGFRNIIPIPWVPYNHFDVVACTPLERLRRKSSTKLERGIATTTRALQIMEDEIFDKDILELKKLLPKGGTITFYAPPEDPGPAFEFDELLKKSRLALSEQAWKNPMHFYKSN